MVQSLSIHWRGEEAMGQPNFFNVVLPSTEREHWREFYKDWEEIFFVLTAHFFTCLFFSFYSLFWGNSEASLTLTSR